MSALYTVTDADFEPEVLQAASPVLVDFWADWCVPCRMMAPVLEKMADELQGQLRFVKMDVQASPDTPVRLGVLNIPTMILFRDGEVVERFTGAIPARRLAQKLQEALA